MPASVRKTCIAHFMRAIVIRKGKHRYNCANTDRSPFLLHFLAVFFNMCLFLIILVTLSLSFNYLSFYSVHLSFYSLHLSFYSLHFFFLFTPPLHPLHLSFNSIHLLLLISIHNCAMHFPKIVRRLDIPIDSPCHVFIHGERERVQFQVSFVRARMHTILERMDLDIV